MKNFLNFLQRRTISGIIWGFTLILMAWMGDHGLPLKKNDISPYGILSLEFADSLQSAKILEQWTRDSVVEETPPFSSWLVKKSSSKQSLMKIAENDLGYDFLFIVFYSLSFFYLLSFSLSYWKLNHIKILFSLFSKSDFRWLSFLSGKKILFCAILIFLIAGLDIIENITLLNIIEGFMSKKSSLYSSTFLFTISKFSLLLFSTLIILYTFYYRMLITLFIDQQVLTDKIKQFISLLKV